MLTKEQNDLLTHTGPGTLMGSLIRLSWQPVVMAEELPAGGAPLSIRLLGEDLVLFKDEQGRIGLLSLHCSHRRADLSYGRVENGGLRCLYHGWLYDIYGRCLEQPGEPAGSEFCASVRHLAYPCRELGGIIFTYMGLNEPPPFPQFDAFAAPESHRFVFKVFQECNYLQTLEGNLDPAHVSFLHKLIGTSEEKNRMHRFAVKSGQSEEDTPALTQIWSDDVSPTIEFESGDFGIRYVALRKAGPGRNYIRGGSWFMPNLVAVPASTAGDGYTLSWHVPIDDDQSWRLSLTYRRSGPVDPDGLIRKAHSAQIETNYKPIRNKSNRFLQNRDEMKTGWASGLGPSVVIQDVAITDTSGPIVDRTQERLGYTDKVITATRLMIIKALKDLEAGREPLANKRIPLPVVISDIISDSEDWKEYYRKRVCEEEVITAKTLGIGV